MLESTTGQAELVQYNCELQSNNPLRGALSQKHFHALSVDINMHF